MSISRHSRRALLLGAAALLSSGSSGFAQGYGYGRARDPLDDGEDGFFAPRRRTVPREEFYGGRTPSDPYGSADGDPFGQNPYGRDPRRRYGQDPRGQDPQGQDPYGRDPYGQDPYGRTPSDPSGRVPSGRGRAVADAEGGFDPRAIYARVDGDPFPIPAFDFRRVPSQYLRREVSYPGREPAGTIVVDPRARHLYFVEGGGRAIRYGVGVGRQGFAWSGAATVNSKQAWPDWYPPKEMIARDPRLARNLDTLQSGIGMHGGPGNPLGARAMYLWQGGKDTLYRIHGTVEPWTIGTSVSSGCIRMVNQDAIDLYGRVGLGANVVVLG